MSSPNDQVGETDTSRNDCAGRQLAHDAAVDLHLHTLASDGGWQPLALIDYLADHDFQVAAVCDHDTQRSVPAAMARGAERGLCVVPAVEVTVRWNDRQFHLLVYGIAPVRGDEAARPFHSMLVEQDERLQELAEDARARIEATGKPLPSLEKVLDGRVMWPFHVLMAAIEDKHVPSLKEAAELVVALGSNFTTDQPLERVVATAHEAGGICVLAHPGRPNLGPALTAEELARMLAAAPIDGLEAHYRSYSDEETARYREMAERFGLLTSSGSDSHAPTVPVDPRPWRAAWCGGLLERLGFRVAPTPEGEPVWAPGMDPLAVQPAPPPNPESVDQTASTEAKAETSA
ncbi:MAG: PHP domain-containing protein, partial [Chloroflexia bacterium]|nr:PHP domain-containing protein [Chloroflexia bacterium]